MTKAENMIWITPTLGITKERHSNLVVLCEFLLNSYDIHDITSILPIIAKGVHEQKSKDAYDAYLSMKSKCLTYSK